MFLSLISVNLPLNYVAAKLFEFSTVDMKFLTSIGKIKDTLKFMRTTVIIQQDLDDIFLLMLQDKSILRNPFRWNSNTFLYLLDS